MRTNVHQVIFVITTFFFISFLTNIVGPIVPQLITDFKLSLVLVALLPFSFFIAYAVSSLPSGMLVERYGDKYAIALGWALACMGSLFVVIIGSYGAAIAGLFLIGFGMAMLQVAINPLLRRVVGESNFAFYSTLAQLFFGLASFLSPWCYTWIVTHIDDPDQHAMVFALLRRFTPEAFSWVAVYWVFAVLSLVLVAVTVFWKFPPASLSRGEADIVLEKKAFGELIRMPKVYFFFFAIFSYVGSEQGIANWISQFLYQYHGLDPLVEGARTISHFWGLMTVGTVAGLALLRFIDSSYVLVIFTSCALLCLTAGLFGPTGISPYAFSAIGFFASVMWPIVISLALNSVARFQGTLSGILITGICGGAVVPLIIGALSDHLGLRTGMCLLYVTLGYLLIVGLQAVPHGSIKSWIFGGPRRMES